MSELAERMRRGLRNRVSDLFRRWEGPLTRDLVRDPGPFGLGQLPRSLVPESTTRTVCGYCSTGCGLEVHLREGEAINVSPSTEYPVNLGMACPKGWEALTVLESPDRATTPMIRNPEGELVPTNWDSALRQMVERFRRVKERHGGDAMAFLGTGQIPTEEMAVLGSVARFGMGIRHGDGNTRQCMATSVRAYKESFGFDAPPFSYVDFEESDVIVLVGSNLCIAHPIQWERICRNPHSPEIVVIDPRRTETAMAGTQHVALQPKSDLLLFYALAHILIKKGLIDRDFIEAHTEGFEGFARHVVNYSPEQVTQRVGLSEDRLEELADLIGQGKRVSFWWTMGVNQGFESTRTAQSIINLALMTGNMGRPGTGANSITGQCNAMGSRLFSNTSGLLGGHEFSNPQHRERVASILGIDAERIPDQGGLAYDQIIDGIREGRIKALWVIATNGAHSWIDSSAFRQAMKKLDVLVVQDMYRTTETARLADILLPAAGWGEKEGTFINSERRFGLLKKIRHAPGKALPDFHIFRLVAEYWGCGDLVERWKTPEDVFHSLKVISRGQSYDFTGIEDYQHLDRVGGIQWPAPASAPGLDSVSERRLFEDGRFFRANGRALFCFEDASEIPEPVDSSFPLVLLTGRGSSSQWHTETRTNKSAVLRRLYREDPVVEIHPDDAKSLGIVPGDSVRVVSQQGAAEVRAVITATVQAGQVFISMHSALTNQLLHQDIDPYSRQPNYKYCAVRIESPR